MKQTLIGALAAAGMLSTVGAVQAEIICTNRGCWETGGRIYRHGGVYAGLPYVNHRDDGRPKKRVRIRRESW
jgi:hypothetical protein